MSERVLVVAAHPDDEALGCGATMARHSTNGDTVDVVFIADGVSSRAQSTDMLEPRRQAAHQAAEILGARPPRFLDFADNRLDSVALLDVTQAIERTIAETDPTIIYTHHGGDLNVDHRVVHQAVVTALRPMPASRFVGLFAFEVASSTEWATSAIGEAFRPDRFIDVSAFMSRKIAALNAYHAEMRPAPHARSLVAIEALATLRGASAGLGAAEAFITLKWIER